MKKLTDARNSDPYFFPKLNNIIVSMAELLVGAIGAGLMYSAMSSNDSVKPNVGTVNTPQAQPQAPMQTPAVTAPGVTAQTPEVSAQPSSVPEMTMQDPTGKEYATVEGEMQGRNPFQSCLDQQGAWVSSNLLPDNKANISEDWAVYNPGNLEDKNFLEAGHHFGVNTVGTSLRNANKQLRSEPIIPKVEISPFLNSTIDSDSMRRRFDIQDF